MNEIEDIISRRDKAEAIHRFYQDAHVEDDPRYVRPFTDNRARWLDLERQIQQLKLRLCNAARTSC